MSLPYYNPFTPRMPDPMYFRAVDNQAYGPQPGKLCRLTLLLEREG